MRLGHYDSPAVAARLVHLLLKRECRAGYLWLRKADGRIKVCGASYKPTGSEILLGVFDQDAPPSVIEADIALGMAEVTAGCQCNACRAIPR